MTGSQISLPVPAPLPPAPGTGRHHTRAGVSQPGAQELIPAGGGETATGMSPRVIGIDPSITSTGVATVDGSTLTIRTKAAGDARLPEIRNTLAEHLTAGDLAVIEDLPTHAHGAGITGMAQGVIRLACYDHAVTFVTVVPATLKKYATGKGNATKADMRMALYQRAGIDERDDNKVDAWWLRAMGLDQLGHAVVPLPKVQRDQLAKVAWPELVIA